MTTNLIFIFIGLNICNVILQTIMKLCTINSGKVVAATVSAVAYGVYTVVIVYTVCDLPLLTKALIVAGCNLIGVYIVKLIEEKTRKDKLWKVEATVKGAGVAANLEDMAQELNIPYYAYNVNTNHIVFNFFCATQKESADVKHILDLYNAKYFVSETKTL